MTADSDENETVNIQKVHNICIIHVTAFCPMFYCNYKTKGVFLGFVLLRYFDHP